MGHGQSAEIKRPLPPLPALPNVAAKLKRLEKSDKLLRSEIGVHERNLRRLKREDKAEEEEKHKLWKLLAERDTRINHLERKLERCSRAKRSAERRLTDQQRQRMAWFRERTPAATQLLKRRNSALRKHLAALRDKLDAMGGFDDDIVLVKKKET